jgi:hypothetical protein
MMNVLMFSSEHAFPFNLRDMPSNNDEKGDKKGDDKGFNLTNMSQTVFAGKVPSDRMHEQLVGKLGMGQRLVNVFLASYSGHIWNSFFALTTLKIEKEKMSAGMAVPMGVYGYIAQCIAMEPELPGITDGLKQMAEHGFGARRTRTIWTS